VTIVEPLDRVDASLRVPGDKSISHRAVLLGALAPKISTIRGLSHGEDVANTVTIVRQLGATVTVGGDVVRIEGRLDGLHGSTTPLQCGNSGTTMRLLLGYLAGIAGEHELHGDPSLSRRPMDRVAEPLGRMGVVVRGRGPKQTAPLHVTSSGVTVAIDYDMPVVSAQVKSAILLAGLVADGPTTVREATPTRTNTEDMLEYCGVRVSTRMVDRVRCVTVWPGRPGARDWTVPADPSQAAFFVVLGLIHPRADVRLEGIYAAPERTGFLRVLARMGGRLDYDADAPSTDVRARSSSLQATTIESFEIPSVDEVPILVVAACAATGVTRFRDVAELRLKESDRFAKSLELATALGANAWAEGDDLVVEGVGDARAFGYFHLDAELDHRMVMAATVAGLCAKGCEIDGGEWVASSYPSFFDDVSSLR